MPANNKYVKRWRNWIEKKKLLTADEIDEIETYLVDKMESIQNQTDISDRSAFNQALDIMGEQGLLAEEYTKIRKSPFDKLRWWVTAQTTVSVFLVIFFLFSQFGSNNTATFQWNIFALNADEIKKTLFEGGFKYTLVSRGGFDVVRVKNNDPLSPTYDILFIKNQSDRESKNQKPISVIQYFYGSKKFASSISRIYTNSNDDYKNEIFSFKILTTEISFFKFINKTRFFALDLLYSINPEKKFVHHCYVIENDGYIPETSSSFLYEIERSLESDLASKNNKQLLISNW